MRRAPANARDQLAFAWVRSHPGLKAWRIALAEWARQSFGKGRAIQAGNKILEYLQLHPGPADPEMFCRRDRRHAVSLVDWYRGLGHKAEHKVLAAMRAFFAWYLEEKLAGADLTGEPIPSRRHWNPIPVPRGVPAPVVTAREALPIRRIRELFEILVENDSAWSKSLGWDLTAVRDPQSGQRITVWCPVRTWVLALKLLLPLRLSQLQRVDSGEGDTLRYLDGQWQANTGPHAPTGARPVQQGFLRAYETDRGRITGFWINTNKTAARLANGEDRGYAMPWEHRAAIALVDRLARWQATYNPIKQPLAWSQLHDRTIQLTAPRSGRVHFLTRDPNGRHRNEPITQGRIQGLWLKVNVELERRLRERGECLADGRPIRLTRRDDHGNLVARYDLHSLRVSWLTALATDGGVPLDLLSKSVAGHGSRTMTAYYVKRDPLRAAELLREAEGRIDRGEEQALARQLIQEARDHPDGAHGALSAGWAALTGSDGQDLTVVDVGLCPVGRSRCGDGGPPRGDGTHGPVPGGAFNCILCRFLMTHQAFLTSLVARANVASMNLELTGDAIARARTAAHQAENRWAERAAAGEPDDGLSVSQARDRLAQLEDEHAIHLMSWDTARRLSLNVIEKQQTPGPHLMVAGEPSDLTIAVRATSSFELMDAVCRAATVHFCPPQERAIAVQRRGQGLDDWLEANGRPRRFLHLDEDQSLAAGNAATRLLRQLCPTHDLGTELLTRHATSADVVGGVERLLSEAAPASPSGTGLRLILPVKVLD